MNRFIMTLHLRMHSTPMRTKLISSIRVLTVKVIEYPVSAYPIVFESPSIEYPIIPCQ
jgi:hypothetical protein